jgi:hypothetical protein
MLLRIRSKMRATKRMRRKSGIVHEKNFFTCAYKRYILGLFSYGSDPSAISTMVATQANHG